MNYSLGERIRFFRVLKSLSQENIANELEISVAAYSNIERNVTDLTVSRLFRIAEILDITIFDILQQDPPAYRASDNNDQNYTTNNSQNNMVGELEKLRQMMKAMQNEINTLKEKQTGRKKK